MTKNRLNTTSSTESEIVSVGEKLPKHMWYRKFRVAQGEHDHPDMLMTRKKPDNRDILYQDNESATSLKNSMGNCQLEKAHDVLLFVISMSRSWWQRMKSRHSSLTADTGDDCRLPYKAIAREAVPEILRSDLAVG